MDPFSYICVLTSIVAGLAVTRLVSGFGQLLQTRARTPPYWVHAVLWGPLILITGLAPLRPLKGLMIALQYHHRAGEGHLTR